MAEEIISSAIFLLFFLPVGPENFTAPTLHSKEGWLILEGCARCAGTFFDDMAREVPAQAKKRTGSSMTFYPQIFADGRR
jgi:hypothetical protein